MTDEFTRHIEEHGQILDAVESAPTGWWPRSLTTGILRRAQRKPWTIHSVVLAICGIALTLYLIARAKDGDFASLKTVLSSGTSRLWGFFAFTNVYLLLKGLALRRAARCCNVRTSFWRTTRVFCESSLLGLTVAKIASDVYKFVRVGEGSRADRIRAIVVYRVAAIIAVLILSALVSVMWAETLADTSRLIWLIPVLVVGGLLLGFRTRVTDWIVEHGRYLLLVLPFSLGALAAKIGGLAVLLGVSLDSRLVETAAAFLLIGSLASMTQVPAGLGMLDAGYAVFLTKFLGASGAETAAFLIAFRLLGPIYTAGLGAVSMAACYFERPKTAAAVATDPAQSAAMS